MIDRKSDLVKERLLNNEYEHIKYLTDFSYDTALIGVTVDNRTVYDFEKMAEWLIREMKMDRAQALEWIEFNVIRALSFMGKDAPIIMYPLKN